MTLDLTTFRVHVLQAVQRALNARPGAALHLLYTPELHDPLPEVANSRRESSTLMPASGSASATPWPSREHAPSLITLDARRVAPYLLEQHHAIDDPLFEASIAQAHAESVGGPRHDPLPHNDETHRATRSVAGWLLTTEPRPQLAQRLMRFSLARAAGQPGRHWVRWTQPEVLAALWPALHAPQRQALLGDAVWFTVTPQGELLTLTAEAPLAGTLTDTPTVPASYLVLDPDQATRLRNAPLVADLLPRWQALNQEAGIAQPPNAENTLHRLVQQAQAATLDAEGVVVYVLTAVQLREGATTDPRWQAAVARTHSSTERIDDALTHLPPEFWNEWGRQASATTPQGQPAG